MVWNGDNRCKWSLDAGSLIIYLFRGEREKGWLGVRQRYLVQGQNWSWSDPLLFPKLEHFLRVFIFASVFFLPCRVIPWFLRLSNVTFIIVTRNGMTSYYLFQGHRNQRTSAEREARNIALDWYFCKQKTRNTMRDTSSIASADFSYYHYFFFFFFFSSTLRVEKEGRLQISSVTTKRRNFVLRVNTDEPAALTSAPLSHFTLFIRLSATLSRPRPFIRAHGPYFQSTDLL